MTYRRTQMPIDVMLVEDDPATRFTLSRAIQTGQGLNLVAAVGTVADALNAIKRKRIDVLMTDLGLPDGSGVDVIRACVKEQPNCHVLVISISSDQTSVLASIEAGASGYILKTARPADIAVAVHDIHAGGAPMSPPIARMVLTKLRSKADKPAQPGARFAGGPSLTKKESEILALIARGESYGEVARALSVSIGTIQTHIKSIYGKLSVHSRGEAVFEAHRRGWISLASPSISD